MIDKSKRWHSLAFGCLLGIILASTFVQLYTASQAEETPPPAQVLLAPQTAKLWNATLEMDGGDHYMWYIVAQNREQVRLAAERLHPEKILIEATTVDIRATVVCTEELYNGQTVP